MCRNSFADNLAQIYSYMLQIEDITLKVRKEDMSHDQEIKADLSNFITKVENNTAAQEVLNVTLEDMHHIKNDLADLFLSEKIIQFVLVLVVLEHVALAFKTFVSAMIGEKPLWVSKHEVKIEYQIE